MVGQSINAVLPLQLNAKVVIFALLSHVFRTLKCFILSVVQQGGEPLAHKREHVPHLIHGCLAVVVKHLNGLLEQTAVDLGQRHLVDRVVGVSVPVVDLVKDLDRDAAA